MIKDLFDSNFISIEEKDSIEKHEEFIVEQYWRSKKINDQDISVVIDDLSLKSEELPF